MYAYTYVCINIHIYTQIHVMPFVSCTRDKHKSGTTRRFWKAPGTARDAVCSVRMASAQEDSGVLDHWTRRVLEGPKYTLPPPATEAAQAAGPQRYGTLP